MAGAPGGKAFFVYPDSAARLAGVMGRGTDIRVRSSLRVHPRASKSALLAYLLSRAERFQRPSYN
jgi:hypothetical protein